MWIPAVSAAAHTCGGQLAPASSSRPTDRQRPAVLSLQSPLSSSSLDSRLLPQPRLSSSFSSHRASSAPSSTFAARVLSTESNQLSSVSSVLLKSRAIRKSQPRSLHLASGCSLRHEIAACRTQPEGCETFPPVSSADASPVVASFPREGTQAAPGGRGEGIGLPPPPPAAFPSASKPPEPVVVSTASDAAPLIRFLLSSSSRPSLGASGDKDDEASGGQTLQLSPRFLPRDLQLPRVESAATQETADGSESNCSVYLLQFESCPFCRKVRACLDFLNIPYTLVEVEPLLKKELKPFGYSKVPLLVIARSSSPTSSSFSSPPSSSSAEAAAQLARWAAEDAGKPVEERRLFALADSKAIAHALMESRGNSTGAEGAENRRQREVQWLVWTDQVLVQLIVMNVYRTMQESLETFSYLLTHPSFSYFQQLSGRWTGSVVMRLVAGQRKKRYAVDDVRQALYEALDDFRRAFEESGSPFFGGAEPDEVDLAVFGILNSTEGCSVEKDILQNSSIVPWLTRMRQAVGPSKAFNHISRGPSSAASS
ncbi:prostaglandin-E synthase [Toxoplasma gondii VAND]|uniref:Prostaglandin E synthase 2 n=1 Tax=Toxoplasma gondii VAND TaxID=933077 RepID=A0A086PJQ0_TOXGO|nr:prostaglandin-E synthase [Toxoplasma gondii VAND]